MSAARAIRAALKDSNSSASEKILQHKSLLLFCGKKVIVAKVKLCNSVHGDHNWPPSTVAADIIPRVVE